MSIALAVGSPGAETPYSVSIPITRRALMTRAYEARPGLPAGPGGACRHATWGRGQEAGRARRRRVDGGEEGPRGVQGTGDQRMQRLGLRAGDHDVRQGDR